MAVGTAHPDATKYPGYVLVHQIPKNQDDGIVRRFYAAPRLTQEEYNFETSYPYGDENYPRITRTYFIPRGDYVAIAAATADPIHADMELVEQQQGRTDDREIDNYFIICKRIYEKVPGVVITSHGYNQAGEYETRTTQLVAASTAADADALLVNKSDVEAQNTIVGAKNKITVASRPILTSEVIDERGDKATITEQVVDPGTDPDAVSTTVKESATVAETPTKSRKKTSTSTASPLTSEIRDERGDKIAVVNSVVSPGTDPDAISLTVVDSQVKAINIGRSEKTTSTSDGPSTLTGEEINERGDKVTVVDDIVAPGTDPDAVSTTVESSAVKALNIGRSRRVTVTSVSPSTLTTKQVNERGDIETLTDDIVTPTTSPDADGLLVTRSEIQAINKGRSKKLKGTVASHSTLSGAKIDSGLLGVTTLVDDIVAAGTSAAALQLPDGSTPSVIESTVEPISATKSRRRTTKATGPITLAGERINDRGDTETTTQSIVAAGADPDADAILQISSQVEPIDSVKSKKTTTAVPSHTTLASEIINDRGDKVTVTDAIVAPGTDPDALSVTVEASGTEAISGSKSRKKTSTSVSPSTLTTKRVNERGDVESTTDDIVAPATTPDADGLLVTNSQIVAMNKGRSKKLTSSVPSHSTLTSKDRKSGLLGTTRVIDDIVDASTSADSLELPNGTDLKVIASEVAAISATKSRRRTTKATGPIELEGAKINTRGDTETIIESIIAAGDPPDTDSLLQTASQVESIDEVKSKKTTSVVPVHSTLTSKFKKSGLLGNSRVISDIVDPSTSPDALALPDGSTLTVLESEINVISATKAERRTTSATGPISLTTYENKPGLLGLTNIVESIVAADASPTALSTTVLESTVENLDSVKAKKRTITATGPSSLAGKKINERGDTESITQTIVAVGSSPDTDVLLQISSEVEPIDAAKSKKVTSVVPSYSTLTTKQQKSGLLGATRIIDDIVASSTSADALELPDGMALSVIESEVVAVSATKSRRRTTKALGPIELTGARKQAGLLGEVTVDESIVAAGADADFLTTTVVSSTVESIDEVKSKKTTITSIGPLSLSGLRMNSRGDIEGVYDEIVDAGATVSPDFTILSAEVTPIDQAKSKKTTVSVDGFSTLTGSEVKPGLLGETSTTDDVVAPSASLVPLSTTVLSSTLEQIDIYRSRLRTVTASGPSSLAGKRVNARGDTETVTETIVAAGASPDSDAITQISSEVTPIDSAKSKKTTAAVASNATLTSEIINERGDKSTITDAIVAPGTDPDALSVTVESSATEAQSATKSRKRTSTSVTPSTLTSKRVNERGDVETTIDDIVATSTSPDTDGILVTRAEVQALNKGRSKKLKSSVASHSSLYTDSEQSGLMGYTRITDDIIAAGSGSDDLEFVDGSGAQVIASVNEAISATKGRKRTTRTYGPVILAGSRKNERGDTETVTQSIVASGVAADTGYSIISSEVEPINEFISKSVTAVADNFSGLTGVEQRPGLLGITSTSDDIVPAGTDAEPLTISPPVLQSTVEPIDAFKSRKRTITASGPLTLSGVAKGPGLLGEAGIVESIVDYGADADALSTTVLESSVEAIDGAKSKKRTKTATGPSTLASKRINQRGDIETVTESIIAYAGAVPDTDGLLQISSQVEAIDGAKSKKTTVLVPSHTALQTLSIGAPNLIPEKYKRLITETQVESIVAQNATLTALTGDLVLSQVKQTSATKAIKTNVSQTIAAGDSLVGSMFFEKWGSGIAQSQESLVDDLTDADSGFIILDSVVEPLGNGKSIRRTTVLTPAVAYTELIGSTYDNDLETAVGFTEQVVAAPADIAAATVDAFTEYTPIDEFRALKRVIAPPTDALDAYFVSFPSYTTLDLPNILESIEIVWTNETSEGSQDSDWQGSSSGVDWSLGGQEGGSAHSSAVVIPQLNVVIREVWAKKIPTTSHFFFLPMIGGAVTSAAILAAVSASAWPVFQPRAISIPLKGMKVAVQASANGAASARQGPSNNAWDRSTASGTGVDLNFVNETVHLPPTIHGEITLSGGNTQSTNVTAQAIAFWEGINFPSINITATKTQTVSGLVSITSIGATTPSSIPTSGLYLIDAKVEPYKYGYARIFAEVLDASVFA